jgi:hypothetical protein
MTQSEVIDLGSMQLELSQFLSGMESAEGDQLFGDLFHFHNRASLSVALHPLRNAFYEVSTDWYLSELDDLLRHSLLLYDTVFVRAPFVDSDTERCSTWKTGGTREKDVDCTYTYFSWHALKDIEATFGDVLVNGELVLLPKFYVTWEEDDADENGYWTRPGSDPYTVGAFLGPITDAEAQLRSLQEVILNDNVAREFASGGNELRFPVVVGGKTSDLIKLRRDERETFSKWQGYAFDLLSTSAYRGSHLREAVITGIAELEDRLIVLKKKGVLDALQMSILSASVSFAAVEAGLFLPLSSSLAAAATVPAALKSLLEQREGRREIRRDPVYFMLAAKRLHSWGSTPPNR